MGIRRAFAAEWRLLQARALRTRLGIWLVAIGAGALWLARETADASLVTLAVRSGMLAAVLAVAAAGGEADRAFLAYTLTYPVSPLVVVAARWLAATLAAVLVTVGCLTAQAGVAQFDAVALARALEAGAGAAAAAAACALVPVWLGRGALAGFLFLYVALCGALSPRSIDVLLAPGLARGAARVAAHLAPSIWRYRGLARGQLDAWRHVALWVAAGLPLAALGRRRRLP